MGPSITAFFPCYNDAGTIGRLVVEVDGTLRALTDDYEIIVVNDGSRDHSARVLEETTESVPRLRVVTHEKNRGYGGALLSGFASATKELVFYTDGDGQYDPRELTALWAALRQDVDIVNGFKISRSDALYRVVIGRVYHHTVKLMFGLRIRDVDCDFRLIRRRVFDRVQLESNTGVICVELVRRIQAAGYRFAEVSVHHYPRTYGSSQFFRFRRIARTLANLTGLWWRLVVRGDEVRARAGRAVAAQESTR